MTPTLTERLDHIKAELRGIIELAGRATSGPWTNDAGEYEGSSTVEGPDLGFPSRDICTTIRDADFAEANIRKNWNNAAFIAAARTITPKAAQGMLTLLDDLEWRAFHDSIPELTTAYRTLTKLCDEWEGAE